MQLGESSAGCDATCADAMGPCMSTYEIMIELSQPTVDELQKYNFNLFGFKGVKTSVTGSPLVWFKTKNYATLTDLTWEQDYQAYTSTSLIIPGGKIVASNSYAIGLGQTLDVTGPTGTGIIDVSTGYPGAISINNMTSTQFTTGISQVSPIGVPTPMCAFPLFGSNLDVIAPIEVVLLMFSSSPVNTGTVIEQAYGPGLLIDLTLEPLREVAYDINTGWSWGGAPWGQAVPAQASLVPLLINGSTSLSTALVGRSVDTSSEPAGPAS